MPNDDPFEDDLAYIVLNRLYEQENDPEGRVYYTKEYAQQIGLSITKTRRILVSLKHLGIVGQVPAYNEDGDFAGSAFMLTDKGRSLMKAWRLKSMHAAANMVAVSKADRGPDG